MSGDHDLATKTVLTILSVSTRAVMWLNVTVGCRVTPSIVKDPYLWKFIKRCSHGWKN